MANDIVEWGPNEIVVREGLRFDEAWDDAPDRLTSGE
jgi:hypothetical protein